MRFYHRKIKIINILEYLTEKFVQNIKLLQEDFAHFTRRFVEPVNVVFLHVLLNGECVLRIQRNDIVCCDIY